MISESLDTGNHPTTLTLRIPAKPANGRLVRERVAAFARRQRLAPDDLREFVTAIGEAFANAVEHSHSKVIEVNSWVDGGTNLVATVSDSGCGFTELSQEHPLPPPSAERGRGLAIMKRYSDLFEIATEPGKGTKVLLGRSIRPPGRN
jgi:stage II sporulation protein AB (anti-sigma F factor)